MVDGAAWVYRKPDVSAEELDKITAKLRAKTTPAKL